MSPVSVVPNTKQLHTYRLYGILNDMPRPTKHQPERGDARSRLLLAAMNVIRRKGFTATTVDDICEVAGVTKGAYFYHFKTKEELGVEAAKFWTRTTSALFKSAPYHEPEDPLQRVLAYIEFRKAIMQGELPEWTCLAGTMTQEIYGTHPDIRDACAESIFGHAGTLEPDIAAAMANHGIAGDWTAASLASHTQAVLQGAFVLAKASASRDIALESADHLKRYIKLLFRVTDPESTES